MVVDVQNDFCPGGALGVDGGDEVVGPLNDAINAFEKAGLHVFFTRDWHPPDHISFISRGGRWTSHCVQNTKGAAFREPLAVHPASTIVSKGFDRDFEAYSGFQGTDLRNQLTGLGVEEVVIGGLTTDYCVKETAKDALKAGFKVEVLEDCIRAVDANPGDGKKAIEEMKQAGATFTKSADEIRQLAGTQQ